MIEGENVSFSLFVEFEIEIEPLGKEEERHLVLLSTSGQNSVAILCATARSTASGALSVLRAEGKGEGKFDFSECSTAINGSTSAPCAPQEPIETTLTFELVKHEGVTYVKVTGVGGLLATLRFGEECAAIAEEVEIRGVVWLEDANGEPEAESTTHLIQEATKPASALGGLEWGFFGAHPASIDGSANIELIDPIHIGESFSGLG